MELSHDLAMQHCCLGIYRRSLLSSTLLVIKNQDSKHGQYNRVSTTPTEPGGNISLKDSYRYILMSVMGTRYAKQAKAKRRKKRNYQKGREKTNAVAMQKKPPDTMISE
jgi:hypothetical protein